MKRTKTLVVATVILGGMLEALEVHVIAAAHDNHAVANIPAVGPRGPLGPDVPLSEAETKQFAGRITVEGQTAEAVQAACDRVAKEGVRTVFLPAGRYIFDEQVRVLGSLTVLGEGSRTRIRPRNRNTHLFYVDGDGVRFTRLKLQGADTTPSTTNNTYGITVSGKQNIRVDHCEILGFSYATNFGGEATAQVDHCFIHNRVGSNDQSPYELCAVDTHPGMDGTFVVEGNVFENLRHGVGIRDGSGLIRSNFFHNLRSVTGFRPLVGISIGYGMHNNIPVEGCMPHDIQVEGNIFQMPKDVKYQEYSLGKAANITIDGDTAPEATVERTAPPVPQLQEMGGEGILRWREDRRQNEQPKDDNKTGVRIWDTRKLYTQKNPMNDAWNDRDNWVLVPRGETDYQPRGDLMLEGGTFYLFLFSNKDDSVDLMAKMGETSYKPNEIYKVHDTGLRNFGHGTMAVRLLKNTAEEIVVEHAGVGQKDGKPIVTTYRLLAGKPWLEVHPVERVNQQGMHGKSRICAFVKKEGDDFILDSKREPFTVERHVPAPERSIGIINFNRGYRSDYDFMWFMTFPPGAEKHPLTYLGFHADPFWEDPPRPDRPSVGAQYAYLGEGGVFIGVLNDKDNWKREDVGRDIEEGETYTTRFKAPYAGEWKLVVRLAGQLELPEVANLVKDPGAEGEARSRFRGRDLPLGWGCYEGAGTADWGVTTEQAHSGTRSVFMRITGHDERSIANNALTLGPTAGYSGADAFDAQPHTTYQFSFWMKGQGFKRELNVYGQGWKEPVDQAESRQQLLCSLGSVLPTEQWRQYEGSFTTLAGIRKVALFLGAYGNQADTPVGATIWMDDVFVRPAALKTPPRVFHSRVQMEAGRSFTFRSPAEGTLDYLLIYLWDRTDQTPDTVWTPMDVYRETVAGPR